MTSTSATGSTRKMSSVSFVLDTKFVFLINLRSNLHQAIAFVDMSARRLRAPGAR